MTVLEPREAYRYLATDYDREPNALISLEERTILPLMPNVRGKRVLDVAAGTGRWALRCASAGANAVAVDCCYEMLATSRFRTAVQADGLRLPFGDATADVVFCAFGLGYAPGMFAELRRVVKIGGTILVSDVHPEALRRGWTRSFRHNDRVIHVRNQRYEFDDLRAPDLRLSSLLEPQLGSPERLIFKNTGRLDRFAEAARGPAIFVARWVRE
jgi:SAM-dependent methyltransferase